MNINRILIWSIFICNVSYGQITVNRNFNLELAEKDSIKSIKLERSLNAFLTEAQNGSYSNEYVDSIHQKKYSFFFNKLLGFGKNSPNRIFNNPIIIKSYSKSEEGEIYFISFSLSGIQNEKPFIYRIVEVKAVPYKDHYRFYSPFEERTANFKSEKIGDVNYHYSSSLNSDKAIEFAKFKNKLSKLTRTESIPIDYYKFRSLDELLKCYGLIYSASNCNFLCYDLGFSDNEGKVFLTGTDNENYLSEYVEDYIYYNLPNNENIYWPFIIGVSSYYGGYGLTNTSIAELKQDFLDELEKNPDFDFLIEFKKGRKSSVNNHFSHYVISAILCEEVLNKKSFNEVLELIYSGNDGVLFFENLKDALNVDEDNFNQTILRLINEK
jgi:hypothetical protein